MERRAVERAAALRARSVAEFNDGRPGRALRLIDRAFAVLENPSTEIDDVTRRQMEIELWNSRALPEAEVHGVVDGLKCMAEARQRAAGFADDELLARLHSQTAAIAMRAGLWDLALDELANAERLMEAADDNSRFAILLNAGSLQLFRGELAGTRTTLNRALEHARLLQRSEWIFKAAHNLGYAEFLAGNLPSALALMAEADAADVDVSRGVARLDRARVLVESGLYREADEALAGAAHIFAVERATQDLAEAELERARCALAQGDPLAAERFAASAAGRFKRRSNDQWRRSAELVRLQAELAAGRWGKVLIKNARQLRDDLRREGLRLPARAAGLIAVEAHLTAGQLEAAVAALAEVGEPRRDDPITGRMHTHYVHARVDAARGDRSTAVRRIRRALDELARYQASFGSIDLRTASAVHGRRLAALDIALAAASRRPAAVFAAAERARAVSSRLPPVRPPDDPVAADLLAELRQTIESLRTVEQDRRASAPLLHRRRELERKIVERSWTVTGGKASAPVASLASVRAELAARGRTMVAYVHVGDQLSAVVAGRRMRLQDLGPAAPVTEAVRRVRADLDVLASPRLPDGLRAAVEASLGHSLNALDAALITPLAVDEPLVVVSTGVLGQLPWGSLPSLRGRPVEVVPSATKWLASAQGSAHSELRVAALAGPDLGRGADEAGSVAAAWTGADLRCGVDATTTALTDAARTATVLHVAAHGVHQPENPLFSSVRMIDGPVFAHELHQAGTAPDHVVLSACEVGLATIRPGDEALGLASVLLALGTHSVIAGVARVGDEVAAATMAKYHERLAAGDDSSAALATALAAVEGDAPPPFVNFGAAWHAGLHP